MPLSLSMATMMLVLEMAMMTIRVSIRTSWSFPSHPRKVMLPVPSFIFPLSGMAHLTCKYDPVITVLETMKMTLNLILIKILYHQLQKVDLDFLSDAQMKLTKTLTAVWKKNPVSVFWLIRSASHSQTFLILYGCPSTQKPVWGIWELSFDFFSLAIFGRAAYFSGLFGDPCSVPDCGMGGWVECGEDLFSKGWWRQQCGGQPAQLAYDMPSVYTQYKATRGEEDGSAGLWLVADQGASSQEHQETAFCHQVSGRTTTNWGGLGWG